MGRLWQTVILSRWQPVMAFLPVEAIIKGARHYYKLSLARQAGDCTDFILFLLEALRDALTGRLPHSHITVHPAGKMRVETPVEMRVKTPDAVLAAILVAEPTFDPKQVAERMADRPALWTSGGGVG